MPAEGLVTSCWPIAYTLTGPLDRFPPTFVGWVVVPSVGDLSPSFCILGHWAIKCSVLPHLKHFHTELFFQQLSLVWLPPQKPQVGLMPTLDTPRWALLWGPCHTWPLPKLPWLGVPAGRGPSVPLLILEGDSFLEFCAVATLLELGYFLFRSWKVFTCPIAVSILCAFSSAWLNVFSCAAASASWIFTFKSWTKRRIHFCSVSTRSGAKRESFVNWVSYSATLDAPWRRRIKSSSRFSCTMGGRYFSLNFRVKLIHVQGVYSCSHLTLITFTQSRAAPSNWKTAKDICRSSEYSSAANISIIRSIQPSARSGLGPPINFGGANFWNRSKARSTPHDCLDYFQGFL